ncbi:PREDICTED: 39S ribosomal protein L27, mitochondrial [Ceratosolen solmsi marchali]|uniref:Large ribosomal subunit protein bL27m n=1 Tax=Ceratosolen solmsi marchali TaxID=326594 RepID=A0AAJ6YU45_9HYME|nr:PREDICTED: 39S ribosomal protein L27, mitochondrial [Ceratosolen solmsi marchali]
MSLLSNFVSTSFNNINKALVTPSTVFIDFCRFASKKSGTSTQNAGNSKPKHRGWLKQDGHIVRTGTILVKQRTTRFHPGLNVGFGRNGNLYALHPGKVIITCEKANLNWEHKWVRRNYRGRQDQTIYKKYYNVIPEPEHNRFKLIDKV